MSNVARIVVEVNLHWNAFLGDADNESRILILFLDSIRLNPYHSRSVANAWTGVQYGR